MRAFFASADCRAACFKRDDHDDGGDESRHEADAGPVRRIDRRAVDFISA